MRPSRLHVHVHGPTHGHESHDSSPRVREDGNCYMLAACIVDRPRKDLQGTHVQFAHVRFHLCICVFFLEGFYTDELGLVGVASGPNDRTKPGDKVTPHHR